MGLFDKKEGSSLRDKYSQAVQTAKGVRMDGSADERDGKLYVKGTVKSEDEKNQIWNAIKSVPDWQKDVVADIRVMPGATTQRPSATTQGTTGSTTPGAQQYMSHTVQSGDTLSTLAKKYLGNANDYMDIYNANRDQLSDPDMIRPGQVLKIPQPTHR